MAIYVFIKPVNSDDDFLHVLMTNHEGAIRDYSNPIATFIAEISKWVADTRKGRVVTNVNGIFGVVLDDPMLISDLKIQLDKWRTAVPLCVGVAGEIFDAYKAMLYAESVSRDSMVFYDAEVEKAFEDQVEEELFKSGDEQAAKPDSGGYQFDLPQLELDKEKGEEEKKASGASKKKILDVLMELKEKAPVIAQLKQLDPSAFKAITKLVESLGQIAQSGLLKSETLEKAWPKNEAENQANKAGFKSPSEQAVLGDMAEEGHPNVKAANPQQLQQQLATQKKNIGFTPEVRAADNFNSGQNIIRDYHGASEPAYTMNERTPSEHLNYSAEKSYWSDVNPPEDLTVNNESYSFWPAPKGYYIRRNILGGLPNAHHHYYNIEDGIFDNNAKHELDPTHLEAIKNHLHSLPVIKKETALEKGLPEGMGNVQYHEDPAKRIPSSPANEANKQGFLNQPVAQDQYMAGTGATPIMNPPKEPGVPFMGLPKPSIPNNSGKCYNCGQPSPFVKDKYAVGGKVINQLCAKCDHINMRAEDRVSEIPQDQHFDSLHPDVVNAEAEGDDYFDDIDSPLDHHHDPVESTMRVADNAAGSRNNPNPKHFDPGQSNPEYWARNKESVLKLLEEINGYIQQPVKKDEEPLEKLHEWKKPDGWVQDGKIVVADDRDLKTGKPLPRIIRQGHAGVKMGPNGGAVGATKTPRER